MEVGIKVVSKNLTTGKICNYMLQAKFKTLMRSENTHVEKKLNHCMFA